MDDQSKSVFDKLRNVICKDHIVTRNIISEELDMIEESISSMKLTKKAVLSPLIDEPEVAIDGYEVEVSIGSGSFGRVYRVKELNSGEEFAVKVVRLKDNVIGENLAREMSTLFETKHDNIMRLEKVACNGKYICLIMEIVSYNLCEKIHMLADANLMNPQIIKNWLRQILSATEHLHKNNLVHRDLKPENILVDDSLNVKVADFGSARTLFDGGILTPMVTTLVYRAPELLLGYENYNEKVDIWSIGCILVEMVERIPPFEVAKEMNSESAVLHEIFKKLGKPSKESWLFNLPNFPRDMEEYPEASEITPKLDAVGNDLLLKLLSIDPTKRISAADALNHPYLVEE